MPDFNMNENDSYENANPNEVEAAIRRVEIAMKQQDKRAEEIEKDDELSSIVRFLEDRGFNDFTEVVDEAVEELSLFAQQVREATEELSGKQPPPIPDVTAANKKSEKQREEAADLKYRSYENVLSQVLSTVLGTSYYPMLSSMRLQREGMKKDGRDVSDLDMDNVLDYTIDSMRDAASMIPGIKDLFQMLGMGTTPDQYQSAIERVEEGAEAADSAIDQSELDLINETLENLGHDPVEDDRKPRSVDMTDGANIAGIAGLASAGIAAYEVVSDKFNRVMENLQTAYAGAQSAVIAASGDNRGQAGRFTQGTAQVYSGVSDATSELSTIPGVKGMTSGFADVVEIVGDVVNFSIANTEALAREIGGFSGDVISAQIDRDMAFLEQALRRGEELGPGVARMVNAQTNLEIAIGKLGDSFYETMTPLVVPILNGLTSVVEAINTSGQYIEAIMAGMFPALFNIGDDVRDAKRAIEGNQAIPLELSPERVGKQIGNNIERFMF